MIAVLPDALGLAPDTLVALLGWAMNDYGFMMAYEPMFMSIDYTLFELASTLRFPLELLGLLLSFGGCTLLSIAAAILARTPRPEAT